MKDRCFTADRNLELTNIAMLFVSHSRDCVIEFPRGRDYEVILFTTKDKACYEAMDGSYKFDAPKGTIVYFPKNEKNRSIYIGRDSEVLGIRFNTPGGRLFEEKRLFEAGSCEAALTVVTRIENELRNHRDKDHAFFCSLVYELIYALNEHLRASTPKKFRKLFPVIAELRTHPQDNSRIEKYAAACKMSEVGFRRLFAEYTGMTPVEYRTALRLELANNMLKSGEYSIGDIAIKCGFNSASFFCREYKKRFGFSAGQTGRTKDR